MCGIQACVCTQICAHMCTLIYGPKFDVRCLPLLLPSIFTKTEFMAEPKFFCVAIPTTQLASGICLCFLSAVIIR